MSNPFDQFATEVRAAVPDVPAPAPVDPMASFQAPAPASVMNPPPQANGYGGGYGAPPMSQPSMSQPPMSQPPMGMGQPQSSFTSPGGYGMPPQGGAPPMANGGDFGSPAPPPMAPAPMSSFSSPPPASDPFGGGYGQAPAVAPPVTDPFGGGYGQTPTAAPPVPGASPPPFGMPEAAPEAAPPSPGTDNPFGAPAPQQSVTMPPSPGGQASGGDNPFGAYGAAPASPMPPMPPHGAPPAMPTGAPPNPYGNDPSQIGMPPTQPGVPPSQPYGADPAQSQYNDPWGAQAAPGAIVPAGQPPADPMAGALVPSQPAQQQYGNVDPFSVFATAPAPPPEPAPLAVAPAPAAPMPGAPAPPPQSEDDMWKDMGFDAPVPDTPKAEESAPDTGEAEKSDLPPGELPPGGEWYDARIFTPTLGVMFFKPQELTDSLFLQTDKSLVDALEERPVVAFIVEGSSARSAGVELGHVLLKVNGIDVKNPKEASRLIKEGPRPLPLLFYVPDTNVVVAEGEHMVKYDTRETTAPNSAKDWKPKYVVIGGIIAQPWMMNMYRSKSEYDIAVIETQARRPVSVKVKQFSLQGARIQNDWQGPQMVKYKNKLHPWKYIVILPVARNPIKISSPNLSQLKPVHEGIRRVLLAQNRDRGHHPHAAAPVRGGDPYARPQNGHGGGDPYGHHQSGGGGGGYHHGDGYDSRPSHGGGDPYARGGGDPYSRGGDPYARQQVQSYAGGGGGNPYNNY